MSRLPEGFYVGAATAAHQVEGNNIHSDYWAMEQMENTSFNEPSLDAVDHYNRYEEDIKLMADAGLNAYRFSIEWARIEPEQGKFDEAEIEHYRKVLECCHAHGLEAHRDHAPLHFSQVADRQRRLGERGYHRRFCEILCLCGGEAGRPDGVCVHHQ